MHIDLDLSGIYYFVWSLGVLITLCLLVEIMDKNHRRMDDALQAVRMSRHTPSPNQPV